MMKVQLTMDSFFVMYTRYHALLIRIFDHHNYEPRQPHKHHKKGFNDY